MKIKRYWLVQCEDGGPPTVKHRTFEDAEREAERLARNNRGKTFVILEAMASVCTADVVWTDIVDESEKLPF
jgi:hypothetical protein